jgi:hypothetical protein
LKYHQKQLSKTNNANGKNNKLRELDESEKSRAGDYQFGASCPLRRKLRIQSLTLRLSAKAVLIRVDFGRCGQSSSRVAFR